MDSQEDPQPRRNDESEGERLDRKWEDLLQELRVMQTGVQLTAGFLLTLPFQASFASLDDFQRHLYLALVLAAAVTTALVMAPVAAHRRLSGRHAKERLVNTAHRLVACVLGFIALLLTGTTVFIFDIVVDRTLALTMGGAVAAVLLALLVALPLAMVKHHD